MGNGIIHQRGPQKDKDNECSEGMVQMRHTLLDSLNYAQGFLVEQNTTLFYKTILSTLTKSAGSDQIFCASVHAL